MLKDLFVADSYVGDTFVQLETVQAYQHNATLCLGPLGRSAHHAYHHCTRWFLIVFLSLSMLRIEIAIREVSNVYVRHVSMQMNTLELTAFSMFPPQNFTR